MRPNRKRRYARLKRSPVRSPSRSRNSLHGRAPGCSWMVRLGLYRALLGFGVLQAVTNLGFVLLAVAGKNYTLMVAAIAAENLCGGMGTAAFVALLMSLCDRRF